MKCYSMTDEQLQERALYAKVLNFDTGRENTYTDAEPNGIYRGRLLADGKLFAYQETSEGESVLHDKNDVGEITLEHLRKRDGVLVSYDGREATVSMDATASRGVETKDDDYEIAL